MLSPELFREVTVGVPASSNATAEAWHLDFLGVNIEVTWPVSGIVEFKVAPGSWIHIYEAENQQPSGAIFRFLVDDMVDARAEGGINTSEAIDIPGTNAPSQKRPLVEQS